MSSRTIAVQVKSIHKDFVLPHEKVSSIKSVFVNPFQSRKGSKETQHALRDVSFTVNQGEFFGIVGRNGSGKSTLLKIIANIYQPTSGSVTVNGRLIPFIELGVGFNSELSGRENVFLSGALMGYSTKEIESRYEKIVSFAELERFMDQKLKNYSSGMQVRLAFSVATMLADSDILLIDEVLAVGDADFQKKCFDYFSDLKKQQKTVIFVTHDMVAVREYCDRAILIDHSEVVAAGKAVDVAKEYSKLFLGSAGDDTDDKSENRWGTDEARVAKVSLSSKRITDEDESIKLTMRIESKMAIEHPVVGFSIKDPKGNELAGTNNIITEQPINTLLPGRPTNVEVSIPNIFNDGVYTLNCAVVGKNGVTYDWWEDAISFRSSRKIHTPHPVYLDMKMKINNN